MLVLSRKKNEHVVIKVPDNVEPGTLIKVHLIKVNQNHVRLGFEAPPDFVIVRNEIDQETGGGSQ